MTNNTYSQYRITSYCYGKTDCPHDPKRLEHIVPYRNVWNVTKWTYFSIEYEIPCMDDEAPHLAFLLNS